MYSKVKVNPPSITFALSTCLVIYCRFPLQDQDSCDPCAVLLMHGFLLSYAPHAYYHRLSPAWPLPLLLDLRVWGNAPLPTLQGLPCSIRNGSQVVEGTGPMSGSILPISISNPAVPNALVVTSVSAKRARDASTLSPQEVQQLGQPKTKAPGKLSERDRNCAMGKARLHAQAALAQ